MESQPSVEIKKLRLSLQCRIVMETGNLLPVFSLDSTLYSGCSPGL